MQLEGYIKRGEEKTNQLKLMEVRNPFMSQKITVDLCVAFENTFFVM